MNCSFCGKPGWTDPRSLEFDDYGGPKQLWEVEDAEGHEFVGHGRCLDKAGWQSDYDGWYQTEPKVVCRLGHDHEGPCELVEAGD